MNLISNTKQHIKIILITLSSLFASLSMCICCALPALLLLLGGGPILAYIFSAFPKLLILEKYSILLFIISGSLIIISGILKWRNNNGAYTVDPIEEKSFNNLKRFNKYLYIFSIIIFLIGTFFTFILPKFYINNSLLINI